MEYYKNNGPVKEAIQDVTDHINRNDGFTLYAWYKRRKKDDKSADDDTKTGSGEYVYHIVDLHCSNPNTQYSSTLESLKFDTDKF